MSTERQPLYYTFGNHMHWVDMEWLWGYHVLPGSVRDMVHLCTTAGAKGNVNFDAIGYEKLAVEAPDALAELRAAIARGQVEVVGASYGQPYGLFHGGESNIRQRTYGVRTVMRLLGVRPLSFWEEEFDFFPQLPQILRGAGFEYASLFFQWTWHTPVVPEERLPAIWWEGLDGSELLAAPRNGLNLHQWPEDFAGLLENPLLREMPAAGIVQWLELMPSPDWMCRAELLLPQLRELMAHPDFELRCVTLSEYLEAARSYAEPRAYTLDDVFHGMSLGKNGDLMRRLSRSCEQQVLAAESLAALSGLFGRPYPSWDVYPTWELEEAWRELLAAQHHDNDECEGLCGFIGRRSYERSLGLSEHVQQRTLQLLADRSSATPGQQLLYNPLGWVRTAPVPGSAQPALVTLPPFGYRVLAAGPDRQVPPVAVDHEPHAITLRRGGLSLTVDRARGVITQLASEHFPEGCLRPDRPLADLQMTRHNEVERFADVSVELIEPGSVRVLRRSRTGETIEVLISLAPELDAVDVTFSSEAIPRPDGLMHAALMTPLAVGVRDYRLVHDHPYGLSEVRAEGVYLKKYPTGDWMTSPQVFEEVRNPFTALQLLDFDMGARGLLYLHDGSQAFLRDEGGVFNLLSMYDPWDEAYFDARLRARVRFVPHGQLTHAERWRLAQEFTRPALLATSAREPGDLPAAFGPLWCDAPNVAITAFYRETEEAGRGLASYAGAGLGFPYVVRLVELNGEPADLRLCVPGQVAAAYRTNLLGEAAALLPVAPADPPIDAPVAWSQLALELRPHEIATIYLDLVLGRKVPRNLDDYRSVWATVHRV